MNIHIGVSTPLRPFCSRQCSRWGATIHRRWSESEEIRQVFWSGRPDSNQRPSAPKADALPGCATPRWPEPKDSAAGAQGLGSPAALARTGLVERLTRGPVHVDGARPGRSIFSPSARCVRPELVEDRAGRCRTMRADRYEHAGVVPHRGRQLLRPAQLRRRAAPEQVGRRRGEHGHVGAECPQLRPHLVKAEVQEMSIEQQHLVNARPAAPSCSRARAAGGGRGSRRRCCLRRTSAD